MFSAGASYPKLKTNLRLSVNRLKLLEKKKTELAQKARKEIADYLTNGKEERAKIRVEHIIREDYMVEAMEVIEMYCDLLLARFGLIQQMKTLDDGLAEAISSLIWVAPRLQADVPEMKVISEQLAYKYGKQYAQACRENSVGTVSKKLEYKLGVEAPPKILVERYLVEIAKSHNVPYEPDPEVMRENDVNAAEAVLIDFAGEGRGPGNNSGGAGGGGMGGPGGGGMSDFYTEKKEPGGGMEMATGASNMMPAMPYGPPPSYTSMPYQPFSYPQPQGKGGPPPLPTAPPSGGLYPRAPIGFDLSDEKKYPPPGDEFPAPPYDSVAAQPPSSSNSAKPPVTTIDGEKPTPQPRTKGPTPFDTLPELPAVPNASLPQVGENSSEDVDFDDLSRRFEELKKKK